jgi:hypothetical protein
MIAASRLTISGVGGDGRRDWRLENKRQRVESSTMADVSIHTNNLLLNEHNKSSPDSFSLYRPLCSLSCFVSTHFRDLSTRKFSPGCMYTTSQWQLKISLGYFVIKFGLKSSGEKKLFPRNDFLALWLVT